MLLHTHTIVLQLLFYTFYRFLLEIIFLCYSNNIALEQVSIPELHVLLYVLSVTDIEGRCKSVVLVDYGLR